VAGRHGLPLVALPAMVADWLRRPGSAPPDEALLERRARDFLALSGRLREPLGDEETRRLRSEAVSALAAGRFADADKALAQAELHSIGGSSDLSALPVEQRLRIGESRADRAAISFLRTTPDAYREAAGRYGEASALIGLADIDRSRAVALAQAKALARLSEDFGGRDGHDAAVTVLRRLLEGLDSLEDTVAFAGAQDALAATLEALAEIAGEADLRVEALARCRAGVEDLHRQEAPLLWHALKVRFGRLAVTLGESRQDDTLLEEAVTALAGALAVWDRSSDEARWLEAEHMISRARAALGRRRNDLALLERAFNGFNRVAKAVDRTREPLRWAELQDQMAGVLAAMGERYNEPVVLEEAVATFGWALEERRRETVPALWAASAANQGLVMMQLAERRKSADLAQQALLQIVAAIEALRAAGYRADAIELQKKLAGAGAMAEALAKR
jgi:tetratricopeptide (TPR) repeat protein